MSDKAHRFPTSWLLVPLKGHLWMIRRYGIRSWWGYEAARRSGMTIDYAAIYTADELAVIGERCDPAPWELAP